MMKRPYKATVTFNLTFLFDDTFLDRDNITDIVMQPIFKIDETLFNNLKFEQGDFIHSECVEWDILPEGSKSFYPQCPNTEFVLTYDTKTHQWKENPKDKK